MTGLALVPLFMALLVVFGSIAVYVLYNRNRAALRQREDDGQPSLPERRGTIAREIFESPDQVGQPTDQLFRPADGHDEHPHASVKTYLIVAGVLAVITAIEVLALSWTTVLDQGSINAALFMMSILKFVLVVMFFMHLKYDNRMLSGILSGGMIFAFGTMMALLALFREPTKPVAAQEAASAPIVADAKAGPGLIVSKGCIACHKLSTVPEAIGNIGPELDGLANRAGTRESGVSAEDYIRQSIMQPAAFVVPGYQPQMPQLRPTMSDQEYEDLIAYLQTLK